MLLLQRQRLWQAGGENLWWQVCGGRKMAEFVRGGAILPKFKTQGSPSTGSEDGVDEGVGEEFDPFLVDQEETDGIGAKEPAAPPESQ